jgi:TP901 family phage tail tape measure protein
MATVGELAINITGNNAALLTAINGASTALRGFGAASAVQGAGAEAGLLRVGVAATAMAAATALATASSINAAADFQDRLAIINTIAHETPEELNRTGEAIRAMSVSSGESLADLSSAFYDLLSAGVAPSQAMAVLQQSTTLAIGGLATTGQTVDLLTTAMNAYGLTTAQTAVATDQFALAVQDGKVHADQIAATFANIAPIARSAGIGIDEIAAGYAVFTAKGVPAAEFTTQMNRAIVELLKPHAALRDLQAETHKNFADIAAEKGLVVALEEMREAASAAGIPFQDLFGRQEAYKFALQTTGPAFQTYQDELVAMHNAGGTAAAQAAERMETFNRQGAILSNSIQDLSIGIGNAFLPQATAFLESISAAVQGIAAWSEANPGLAATILTVVGGVSALVAGIIFLGPILGAIGGALAIIFNPILVIGAAILGLAAHFGLLGEGAQSAADGIGTAIANAIPQVLATLSDLGAQLVTWVSTQAPIWIGAFIAWISPLATQALAALSAWAGQVGDWIIAQAPAWAAQISTWIGAFVDWVGPMIPVALGALGDLGSQIITWIAAQIPGLVSAVQGWVGAFVDWAKPVVGDAIAALGDFAGALVVWVAQQVPVVVSAALPIGAAIISGIIDALASLPGMLGDALGDAVKNFDPKKFAENLNAILTAAEVIAAVVIAAQVVGAAYAAAFGLAASAVKGATALITGAVQAEQSLIAAGVARVGAFVGAAFSAAFSLALQGVRLLGSVVIAAFAPVGAALAGAMAPIGAFVGGALDTAIGVGMAVGVPLLIGAAIGAIGLALANLINQAFPGLAQAMSENFFRGISAVQTFISDTMAKVVGFINTVIGKIKEAIDWVGQLGASLNKAHTAEDTITYHTTGKVPGFATGGVVPGAIGVPQLAVVHGGETVTPAGQVSGTQSLTTHVHVHLDGREIAEIVDQRLFGGASVFSSGFVGSPAEP